MRKENVSLRDENKMLLNKYNDLNEKLITVNAHLEETKWRHKMKKVKKKLKIQNVDLTEQIKYTEIL